MKSLITNNIPHIEGRKGLLVFMTSLFLLAKLMPMVRNLRPCRP